LENQVSILIVDDREPVRKGLRSILASRPDWMVCGEAGDGIEAIEKARELRPRVVLMDISMPRMDGIAATRILSRELPGSDVIIVSQNDPAIAAALALQANAAAYVSKIDLSRDLIPAIAGVLSKRGDAPPGDTTPSDTTEDPAHAAGEPAGQHPASNGDARLDAPILPSAPLPPTSLLAAIVESSDDAIISKSLGGVITSWNRGAERLFGYTADEAIGRHITLIIPPDRQQEESLIIERLKRGEQIDHFETVRMRKNGEMLDISLTISPVRDADGRIVGASKVARDISEKRAAESALRESREQLRVFANSLDAEVRNRTAELEQRNMEGMEQSEQLRALSLRLLQTQDQERRHIARELHDSAGQNLAVLCMTLDRLLQQAGKDAPELAADLEAAAQMAHQLNQDIRTTAYLLHPPLLDESGLGAALQWYAQGLAERSVLEVRLEFSPEIDRLPGEIELVAFRLVQECLTNIHRHSESATAKISVRRVGEDVLVSVADEGLGIPPENLRKLQAAGGTGVGLRGMRERVRQVGGDLAIESSERGTTVSARLPCPRPAAPAESTDVKDHASSDRG
jgi:PAS domain S-box-containing protein